MDVSDLKSAAKFLIAFMVVISIWKKTWKNWTRKELVEIVVSPTMCAMPTKQRKLSLLLDMNLHTTTVRFLKALFGPTQSAKIDFNKQSEANYQQNQGFTC